MSIGDYIFGSMCYQCLPPGFSRFVDRDMIMRYHWGLGVGHVYAHDQTPSRAVTIFSESESNTDLNRPQGVPTSEDATPVFNDNESDIEQPEFELRNRDDDLWEDITIDNSKGLTDDDSSDDSDTMDGVYGA